MNKDLLKVSIRQNAIYLPLIEEEKKQEITNLFEDHGLEKKSK